MKKKVLIVIEIILVILFIISGYKIINWLLNNNDYFESTSHIKYEDYIGGIWHFDTENNGIVDLQIKDKI